MHQTQENPRPLLSASASHTSTPAYTYIRMENARQAETHTAARPSQPSPVCLHLPAPIHSSTSPQFHVCHTVAFCHYTRMYTPFSPFVSAPACMTEPVLLLPVSRRTHARLASKRTGRPPSSLPNPPRDMNAANKQLHIREKQSGVCHTARYANDSWCPAYLPHKK